MTTHFLLTKNIVFYQMMLLLEISFDVIITFLFGRIVYEEKTITVLLLLLFLYDSSSIFQNIILKQF